MGMRKLVCVEQVDNFRSIPIENVNTALVVGHCKDYFRIVRLFQKDENATVVLLNCQASITDSFIKRSAICCQIYMINSCKSLP